MTWPHGDPREVARAILADSRYRLAPRAAAKPSWIDIVWSWIGGLLRRLLHTVDHVLGSRNPFEIAVGALAVAGVLALAAGGVFLLVRSLARGARMRPSARDADFELPAAQSAVALRAAALAAAAAQRYRDAAGLLFAAAAHALDERGRLAYDPARTPGEYRRLVRDPLFDGLASDAVTALFAPAEPRAELFARMNGRYERLFEDVRTA